MDAPDLFMPKPSSLLHSIAEHFQNDSRDFATRFDIRTDTFRQRAPGQFDQNKGCSITHAIVTDAVAKAEGATSGGPVVWTREKAGTKHSSVPAAICSKGSGTGTSALGFNGSFDLHRFF